MELSGVVSRRIPCLPGVAAAGTRRVRPRMALRCGINGKGGNFGGVSMGFVDDGHVKYYSEGARCGGGVGKSEKNVEKNAKKKMKLVKGLYKELSMFSRIGFEVDEGGDLVGDLQRDRISEAAEVLLAQLKQLKAEEKEKKRRRKQEKARLKADRMKLTMDADSSSSSSSSSSSESSDSETDEVINMNRLRTESPAQRPAVQPHAVANGIALPSTPSTTQVDKTEIPCPSGNTIDKLEKKIEVCMGGKCRKSGGVEILAELQKAVGIEGAVVGCKCMGKCKDGPNVRVCNGDRVRRDVEGGSSSVRVSVNPLCIGVGIEDVGMIVSNFLGSEQNGLDVGLAQVPA